MQLSEYRSGFGWATWSCATKTQHPIKLYQTTPPLERLRQMKLLLTTIAAVVLVGCGEKTPSIWIAARDGNLEIVKKHLINGVDINAKDKEGSAPLHKAVARGNEEIVKYLINNGANLNIKDKRQRTPLHWAAFAMRKNMCELLILNGADINPINEDNLTPLDHTPAPKKIVKSESGDINLGVPTIGGESLVKITQSGDLTLGVPSISMGGANKVRAYIRKHGGKTGAELKAEGK